MKQIEGIWLPDDDNHFEAHLRKGPRFANAGTYQMKKITSALSFTRRFNHAIDVGAHVGLWSRVLTHHFTHVTAFEPIPDFQECFVKNVVLPELQGHSVNLVKVALGRESGSVAMQRPIGNTGNASVQDGGSITVDMKKLDDFKFEQVDLIKIDCEGFEEHVIVGGYETIIRTLPTIIVEQKPGNAERYGLKRTGAVELLKNMGATMRREISGDFILDWPAN